MSTPRVKPAVKAFHHFLRKRRNRYIFVAGLLMLLVGLVVSERYLVQHRGEWRPQAIGVVQPNHQAVTATMFWAGEPPDEDNANITNVPSAWDQNWTRNYGGVDDPAKRCGYLPCSFTPRENAFYFALPYNDYDADGNRKPVSELQRIPWYNGSAPAGDSLLKNRWIAVTFQGKTVYAQWQDVGPMNEDDIDYVFGNKAPKYRAGLDLSPAANSYLGLDGQGTVAWKFVNASDVPDGPWKTTVTTSGLDFSD